MVIAPFTVTGFWSVVTDGIHLAVTAQRLHCPLSSTDEGDALLPILVRDSLTMSLGLHLVAEGTVHSRGILKVMRCLEENRRER